MKNEYLENNHANKIVDDIYQAMYKHTDRGFKNGEILLNITCPTNLQPEELSNQIKQYFSSIFSSPRKNLKKYFINVDQDGMNLKVNLKWGYHAIIANAK